jgi:tether containing UBX domain for GLUT4
LTNGSKLDLVVKSSSPTVIDIALQLPEARVEHKFSSATTLWQVLRQFESGEAGAGRNLSITNRGTARTVDGTETGSGQIYYQQPVLNVVGREYGSTEDLQKTLAQCGLSGRVLIRVSFRDTDVPLHEAQANIKQYLNDVNPQGDKKEELSATRETTEQTAGPGTIDAGSAGDVTEPWIPQAQPSEPPQQPKRPTSDPMSIGEPSTGTQSRDILAPVNVFSAPTGPVPAATLREEDETVYEPTIAHAKLHQARLQASSVNRRLKSDEELAAEREAETARLAAVTSLRVKVRFPDQSSSIWDMPATATGATMYAAVRGVMAHSDQRFKLVLPGRQVIADSEGKEKDLLVRGYRLRGSVLLNLTWDDSVSDDAKKGPFLQSRVAEKAQPIPIPDAPAAEEEDEPEEKKPASAPSKPSGSGSGKSGGGVPKWFKGLGGKK